MVSSTVCNLPTFYTRFVLFLPCIYHWYLLNVQRQLWNVDPLSSLLHVVPCCSPSHTVLVPVDPSILCLMLSPVVSAEEVTAVCPDCPSLLPLHNPEGLESVMAALKQFNKDSNQTSYFKLLEVGRLSTGVRPLLFHIYSRAKHYGPCRVSKS